MFSALNSVVCGMGAVVPDTCSRVCVVIVLSLCYYSHPAEAAQTLSCKFLRDVSFELAFIFSCNK